METRPDPKELLEMVHYKMPFGKFKDRLLLDLPEAYLLWFRQHGFPKGKLGKYLEAMLEIKSNGLEPILRKLQKDFPRE